MRWSMEGLSTRAGLMAADRGAGYRADFRLIVGRWLVVRLLVDPGIHASHVPAGDVTEGHDRAEGDARTGIVAPHDAGAIVADRIQAGDRGAGGVEDLTD